MKKSTGYSAVVRGWAVRLVRQGIKDRGSEKSAIVSVAEKIGCSAETLSTGTWLLLGRRVARQCSARRVNAHVVPGRSTGPVWTPCWVASLSWFVSCTAPGGLLDFLQAVPATLEAHHVALVQQPVEDRRGQHLVTGQDLRPVADALVHRDQDAAVAVAVADQPEKVARVLPRHRFETHLVDAQQGHVDVPAPPLTDPATADFASRESGSRCPATRSASARSSAGS